MNNQQEQKIQIRIAESAQAGFYSNMAQISHLEEEFILDFINLVPALRQGTLGARIFMSPGHLKRFIAALQDNLKKYEDRFGTVKAASAPINEEIGFTDKKE